MPCMLAGCIASDARGSHKSALAFSSSSISRLAGIDLSCQPLQVWHTHKQPDTEVWENQKSDRDLKEAYIFICKSRKRLEDAGDISKLTSSKPSIFGTGVWEIDMVQVLILRWIIKCTP